MSLHRGENEVGLIVTGRPSWSIDKGVSDGTYYYSKYIVVSAANKRKRTYPHTSLVLPLEDGGRWFTIGLKSGYSSLPSNHPSATAL